VNKALSHDDWIVEVGGSNNTKISRHAAVVEHINKSLRPPWGNKFDVVVALIHVLASILQGLGFRV